MEQERREGGGGRSGGSDSVVRRAVGRVLLRSGRTSLNARSWSGPHGALPATSPTAGSPAGSSGWRASVSKHQAAPASWPRPGCWGWTSLSRPGEDGLASLLPLLPPSPPWAPCASNLLQPWQLGDRAGQEEVLKEVPGLSRLPELRRLRPHRARRLPGHLRLLLKMSLNDVSPPPSSLGPAPPLLELPYLSLEPRRPAPSCPARTTGLVPAAHWTSAEKPSGRLSLPIRPPTCSSASSSLLHLTLSGCRLTDGLLALLPSVTCCRPCGSLGPGPSTPCPGRPHPAVKGAPWAWPRCATIAVPNALEEQTRGPGCPRLPPAPSCWDCPWTSCKEPSRHLQPAAPALVRRRAAPTWC
ncbi:unnamed protein product [Gadus morhua 'NCC']